jgi:hypothetical protein
MSSKTYVNLTELPTLFWEKRNNVIKKFPNFIYTIYLWYMFQYKTFFILIKLIIFILFLLIKPHVQMGSRANLEPNTHTIDVRVHPDVNNGTLISCCISHLIASMSGKENNRWVNILYTINYNQYVWMGFDVLLGTFHY